MADNSFRTIIWDLDNTILDSFGTHEEIVAKVWPRHGRKAPSHTEILAHFHGPLEEALRELMGECTEEEFQALLHDYLALDDALIKVVDEHLFADAVALIRLAHRRRLRQIIVTNRAHGVDRGNASPRTMIQNSSLRECIDTIICGDECDIRKPHPGVLREVEGFDPATTLVIGDQFVDAEFAHNLGAKGILVNRHQVVPHLERLRDGWQRHVKIVQSLREVRL